MQVRLITKEMHLQVKDRNQGEHHLKFQKAKLLDLHKVWEQLKNKNTLGYNEWHMLKENTQ